MLYKPTRLLFALIIFQMLMLCTYAQPLNQKKAFSLADTLRGTNGPGRIKWDVLHYDITVEPDYTAKTIAGKNTITFTDNGISLMQIDLQQPMQIDSIVKEGKSYQFSREGNVYWVRLREDSELKNFTATQSTLSVYFQGKPREAVRPPWDGGWIWKKDKNNNPWMSVACQGLGASVWYPCKDIQSDEPDNGAILHVIVPDSLVAVSNGRSLKQQAITGRKTMYSWQVKNPINNYNIVPYIGKYVHFSEIYKGKKGKLDMDYWVLDYNLDKAKTQFADAPRMMKAFEYWFGPYPFYEDGFKLVESPHLGMEHQSAIAYGNGYQNGFHGSDLSQTGWGMKWDFIIVHESGHEWFANNITTKDIADMWVHEGFTNYSETLFTDYYYGTAAGNEYVQGIRALISNDIPIIGKYGVNKEGSGDMYFKAGNMLHLIRQLVKSDKKFRGILTGLNKTFYHQTVTTKQVENYISEKAGIDFSKIFDQYLRTTMVPVLEYKTDNKTVSFKWSNAVDMFNMPVKVSFGKKEKWIRPTTEWQSVKPGDWYDGSSFLVDKNFYITVQKNL
ncbi:MAG: M1 family metallopeptidase [Ferruginibacter sp.]|nr:M1 family metallopeptidase [Ferruginibacter sp.]